MGLDEDPLRDSMPRVLQSATDAPAPEQSTWSLYGALDTARRQITAAADGSRDPRADAQQIRRCMQATHQKQPTGVVTQGGISNTRSWMELTEAQHSQEGFDHTQKSDSPQPKECVEEALILILTLHS